MDSDDDKRVNYYRSASPEAQKLYGDEEFGNTLYAIFSRHLLPKEKYSSFVDVFGDTIINLESNDSIPSRLMAYVDLTQIEAENITQEVISAVQNPLLVAPLPHTLASTPTVAPAPAAVPPPAPAAPSLPTSRVMPRNETELPGALLQNLKASLAHDAVGTAYGDEQVPKPSYGAILDNGTGK